MPGVSGVTVVTTLVCSFYFACEAAGASSARHSLRLYVRGERFMNNSGVFTRRDREGVAGSHTGCLKCEGMRIRRRQPGGNEFCLRFANHKPSAKRSGLRKASGVSMLRFKVLASAVPLLLAAFFARGGLLPGLHPCIAVADTSVEISDLPWHADLHVAFTDDPAEATVRVQISDSAEAADFALVDDGEAAEPGACEMNPATRFVTVSADPDSGAPIIYLSHEGPADYRIFVRSRRFSLRDAAALVVGAGGGHQPEQAASL